MGIWVVRTLNQLFIGGSYTEIKFSINKVFISKIPVFVKSFEMKPLKLTLLHPGFLGL